MRIIGAARITAAAVAGAALLVACGGEEQSELKQELAAMTKDLRGKVDPLPQVKTYEPVPYKGESMVDPFVPGRIVVAQASTGGGGGGVQPDLNRPKEPLEAFPLEAVQMFGTLRGRAGIVVDHWLYYATGGLAWSYDALSRTQTASTPQGGAAGVQHCGGDADD